MPSYQRNLVLVDSHRRQGRRDFETIRGLVAERAPDIEVFAVDNDQRHSVTGRAAARRPTLVFSQLALRVFRPRRGKVFAGRRHSKMEEVERMIAGGIRVPETVLVEQQTRLDATLWGPWTVLKPNQGGQGRGIRICRSRDVRWTDPLSYPRDDHRFGLPLLAQRYIDSGPCFDAYRVMTVLGRPVYSIRKGLAVPSALPEPEGSERIDRPMVSSDMPRKLEMNYDRDTIEYAKVVAGVFSEIPVLGIDLVREQASGELYALEVNTSGGVWHISSAHGLKQQRKHGLDYLGQFGALDIIADALIDATRREAE